MSHIRCYSSSSYGTEVSDLIGAVEETPTTKNIALIIIFHQSFIFQFLSFVKGISFVASRVPTQITFIKG